MGALKILIISNMYPSKEKNFSGIFVKNQFEGLKTKLRGKDSIEIFFMKRKFTSKIGSIIKYINTLIRFIPYFFKKYEIIHLHYFYPLIYLAVFYKLFHSKTKIIVTYHGSDLTKKVNKKNQSLLKKIIKKVDYNIVVGAFLGDILFEKLKTHPDKILPVGVNDNVFYYEKATKIYDFIYVGSFIHRKGIDLIIDVVKNHQNLFNICFIGQGDYIEEIQKLSSNNNNISLYVDLSQTEIQKILTKSKFLLLPTRNEGFPTSTIESMYCGVPVLVSDIPQTKEQVIEGYNGFIIPVDDSEALLRKMTEIKNINENEYKKMTQNALKSFREISLSNVCEELIDIYKTVSHVK